MSRWPSVTGSKVPGYSATRGLRLMSSRPRAMVGAGSLSFDISATLAGNVLDALDGDDAFALVHAEDCNTTRATALDRNARHRHPDCLATIADQHEIVRVLDRESGHDRDVLAAHIHGH